MNTQAFASSVNAQENVCKDNHQNAAVFSCGEWAEWGGKYFHLLFSNYVVLYTHTHICVCIYRTHMLHIFYMYRNICMFFFSKHIFIHC